MDRGMELTLTDQAQLLESLARQRPFNHPCTEWRVIQTHISWIVLTGPYAYKIKKALSYPFLDYTTLERRHSFCKEEIRINRRTAPDLYLDLTPIFGSIEQPLLTGDAPPIEYAVRMRQFPDSALLSERLGRGELSTEAVTTLAQVIAQFHQTAEIAGESSPYGRFESILPPMLGNFDAISQHGTDTPIAARLESLRDWTIVRHGELRDALHRRRSGDHIRECHGDLHLGNIVWIDNRPVLFDAIEFDPALRTIDTISECAFTLMDLDRQGHHALAWRLLNDYLSSCGDYHSLELLRFYQVYRAMVRAKVSRLPLTRAAMSKAEVRTVEDAFTHYLTTAEGYTAPPRPRLWLMRGASGCGKSTVARQLSERLGAIQIRSDVERKRLFGLDPLQPSDTPLGEGIYSASATRDTYSRLLSLSHSVVTAGFSTIVDATFLDAQQRQPFTSLADDLDIPCAIIDISLQEQELVNRINQRGTGQDPSDATPKVMRSQLENYRPLPNRIGRVKVYGFRNSVKSSIDQLARKLLQDSS